MHRHAGLSALEESVTIGSLSSVKTGLRSPSSATFMRMNCFSQWAVYHEMNVARTIPGQHRTASLSVIFFAAIYIEALTRKWCGDYCHAACAYSFIPTTYALCFLWGGGKPSKASVVQCAIVSDRDSQLLSQYHRVCSTMSGT